AGDREDLTRLDGERGAFHRPMPSVVDYLETFDLEDGVPGDGFLFCDFELDLPADHHRRQRLFICLVGGSRSNNAPPSQYGDPVRDLKDLFEFVGDENDGATGFLEVAHHLE